MSSANTADVHTDLAGGGLLAGAAVAVPTATVAGATNASVEGDVTAPGGVIVQATSANRATSEVLLLAIGGLGAAAVNASSASITAAAATWRR